MGEEHQARCCRAFPGPAALVLAHPGHELCIHAWLGRQRPRVFLLTDGSGRRGQARLDLTTRILREAGAKRCAPYGCHPDAAIYQALLGHRFDLFLRWLEALAAGLVRERITHVAADAAEGYNPSHDVCRLLVDAAVEIVRRRTGRPIANYDFAIMTRPARPAHLTEGAELCIELTNAEFARKLAAARDYQALSADIKKAITTAGLNAFRVERLRPVRAGFPSSQRDDTPPLYEAIGEQRVTAGHYREVLRYRQHVVPLIECLKRYLEGSVSCAA